MNVRTNLRSGEGIAIDPQQLAPLLQPVQELAGQVDSGQLSAIAGQFGFQVDPQQVQSMLEMASGATGPQQFLSMIGQ